MSRTDIINIVIIAIFGVLSILMLFRFHRLRGKVIIQDQQWSAVRIMFLILGLLTFINLVMTTDSATLLDYIRLAVTLVAITVYMMMRDGVGEEGMVAGGKFIPWHEVRSYDYEEKKHVVAVYFTVESQNEKKPDNYTTKELDFSNDDKENLFKFLKMNLGRKYTRMKKRK